MERARASWTDERLDDLASKAQRIMIQFGGGITLAVLATLVSVIATRA